MSTTTPPTDAPSAAAQTGQYIFYDIDSLHHRSWSPATLRTYQVLVHFNLPYLRKPISMGDVASTSEALGVPPRPPTAFLRYTFPTLVLPTGEVVNDSDAIASALQQRGVGDDAFWNPELRTAFFDTLKRGGDEALLVLFPYVPLHLDEPGREYYYRTRNTWFGGKTMQQFAEEQKDDDPVEVVVRLLEPYAALYDGVHTFIKGSESVTYADFCVMGMVGWIELARGEETVREAVKVAGNGRLEGVYNWVKKNVPLPNTLDK